MSSKIPATIRESVKKRAANGCEYCLLPDANGHFIHQVDHILPRKHGGETLLENLALACWRCNLHKGSDIGSFDFETDEEFAKFFNPRTQIWTEHFQLLESGEIKPLTAEARVTIKILQINNDDRIKERKELIEVGLY